MILSSELRFLIEDLTFIMNILNREKMRSVKAYDIALGLMSQSYLLPRYQLLVAVNDAPLIQVIRRNLKGYPVSRQDANVVHTHLSCNMSQHLVPIFQLHSESCVRQCLYYLSVDFDCRLFCQNDLLSENLFLYILMSRYGLRFDKIESRKYLGFAFANHNVMLKVSGRLAVSGKYCPPIFLDIDKTLA